ncbi:putative transporter-like protein [Ectopseudomonas mendocina]|uniref:Putative transporter-like protein n=1 Tax=Ectopseudomonas mendocina TaxID=300 RepID=A0A379PRL6_ECTME|nr:AAA family ATPase [Pseudomonas mendocina]SUE95782.1 putative transporter-like protein [Pseudomonas mendocina]
MSTYLINKSFKTTVTRSQRVLECAEAFGLGLEDKEFTVYDNLMVDIAQGDVIYITGQSGSGKSLMLKELVKQIAQEQPVADIDKVELLEVPLIDQVGSSTEEAIRILNLAGLNDAYLFIRKPSELSDGQRYRFRIAKLMESGCKVWAADEFGAVLDRTTAKVVGFNVRKFAKQCGATLIVATTHKDLLEELAPTIYVEKRFKDKIEMMVTRNGV